MTMISALFIEGQFSCCSFVLKYTDTFNLLLNLIGAWCNFNVKRNTTNFDSCYDVKLKTISRI